MGRGVGVGFRGWRVQLWGHLWWARCGVVRGWRLEVRSERLGVRGGEVLELGLEVRGQRVRGEGWRHLLGRGVDGGEESLRRRGEEGQP